jgi:hypothetical protein
MRYTILLIVVFFCGCAAIGEFLNQGAEITKDEVEQGGSGLAALVSSVVPAPYKIPAAIAIGYIAALIRRIYKKKQGAV